MPLFQILADVLAYSAGLALSLACGIIARRHGHERLRAYTRVMGGAFAIILVFFVQQIVDLVGMPSLPDYAYSHILKLNEFAYGISFSYLVYALGGYFAVSAELTPSKLRVIALKAFPALFAAAAATIYACGLFGALDVDVLGFAAALVTLLVFVYCLALPTSMLSRVRAKPARRLAWRLVAISAIGVSLEIITSFEPDFLWLGGGSSRYFVESIGLYLIFVAASAAYLWGELADSRTEAESSDGGAGSGQEANPLSDPLDALALSPRERDVIGCLLEGMTNQEIADALCVSLSTVKTHIHRILEKTGQTSRTALVARLAGEIQSKDR